MNTNEIDTVAIHFTCKYSNGHYHTKCIRVSDSEVLTEAKHLSGYKGILEMQVVKAGYNVDTVWIWRSWTPKCC